jgi:zinc protease
VEKESQVPAMMIAYHVPETRHPDYVVLQVIEVLLGQGTSSRLNKRVVEAEQAALSINVDLDRTLDPGLFSFVVQPRSGVKTEQIEKSIYEELERLTREPAPAEELQKVRNQMLVGVYRQMKTIAGKANLLGDYHIYFGDYKKLFTFDSELEKVTAADIQRVAKTYFRARNRTVATLVPVKPESNEAKNE